jgi:dTDP-4-dehydrorhamnose reductase
MKTLIIGGAGKLGKELVKIIPNSLAPKRDELDITKRKSVFGFIKNNLPDILIHTAAFKDIRRSETEHKLAWKTNVLGTENLVDACLKYRPNIYFVYISTAIVFDGEVGMYTEKDIPAPKNYYSLTKLLGEFAAKKLMNYLIVRTNFVAKEKWPYPKAFTDRYGTYLFAEDAAKGIKEVIGKRMVGIVHIAGNKKISMFELAKLTTPDIQPVTLKEYSGPPLAVDMTLNTIRWKKYKISKVK